MNKKEYMRGLKLGVPIGMGYFSVSIAFGMMAIGAGLSPFEALIISMTNLTSAGQVAGVQVIAESGSYIEMALTTLMINARYFLMSLSLSQKAAKGLTTFKKAILSFGITDEIFAVASLEKQPITEGFMWGLITFPYIGWASGTLLGAVLTQFLPLSLKDALGIALFGMFIALLVPAAKHSKPVLVTVVLAIISSCVFKYCPVLDQISSGFVVIIVTFIAAGIAAFLFPHHEEEEEESCTSSVAS